MNHTLSADAVFALRAGAALCHELEMVIAKEEQVSEKARADCDMLRGLLRDAMVRGNRYEKALQEMYALVNALHADECRRSKRPIETHREAERVWMKAYQGEPKKADVA